MSHRLVFGVLFGVFVAVFAAALAAPLLAPGIEPSPVAVAHAGLLALAFALLAIWSPSTAGAGAPPKELCVACGRALAGDLAFCAACGTETPAGGGGGRGARTYRA